MCVRWSAEHDVDPTLETLANSETMSGLEWEFFLQWKL